MQDLKDLLEHIPAADCTYEEWVQVGMALKHEGYDVSEFDNWSAADTRYKPGECQRKWNSFGGSADPITAGTIFHMAQERGWIPQYTDGDAPLDYNGVISYEGEDTVAEPVTKPSFRDPVQEIISYLRARFKPEEYVGYVTTVYEGEDGKLSPTRGNYDRTAGQLIDLLERCGGDIGSVLGDADPRAGAWVRVNPLDGKGVKDENVTSYRYVLVESDSLPIEQQNALLHELELPIVTLTHTGGKSLHAIVRIDAGSREEYRQRVAYLFDVCEKNGLKIDRACKNPSRLTRLPGFRRGENRQYLIETNTGKPTFEAWRDFIEESTDDLPDAENAADFWDDIPPLRPSLIDGVLRQGHKMLIAGPSKAGKSFALIALAISIAEGKPWMGFPCAQGRVWYVNLELDDISCKHRFRDVYKALGLSPQHLDNIDIWNLRGRAVPMNKLAPSMIRRARNRGYSAIIIDPIYKVITGDENSAEQMAQFCNQFDKVCAGAECAVIYCHHHSKGAQGGKRSMDRASGSGVFARDPDALLDMIELPISEQLRKTEEDKAVCAVCKDWLRRFLNDYDSEVSQDDEQSRVRMMEHCQNHLKANSMKLMQEDIAGAVRSVRTRTAWRIDGTLREFPKFQPVNVWFEYPVHRADQTGVLKDVDPEETWQKNFSKKKSNSERKDDRKASIVTAFSAEAEDGKASVKAISEYLGVTEQTVRNRLKEHGGFWVEDGMCGMKATQNDS